MELESQTCFPVFHSSERSLKDGCWRRHGRAYPLFHYGPKRTEEIFINLRLDDQDDYFRIAASQDGDYATDSGTLSGMIYSKGPPNFEVADRLRTDRKARRRNIIANLRDYQFHDTSIFPNIRRLADIHQTQHLHEDGGGIRPPCSGRCARTIPLISKRSNGRCEVGYLVLHTSIWNWHQAAGMRSGVSGSGSRVTTR